MGGFENYDIYRLPKQMVIFICELVFVGVCELIDSAFGNHIDLDSVVVLSAYTVITWCTYCVYQIGCYAYRSLLKDAKLCLIISLSVSVILGFLVFSCSNIIPHIYSLTGNQYVLFSKCLRVHAFSLPLFSFGVFMDDYLIVQCKNKVFITGNAIIYGVMILIDVIIYFLHGDLSHLILGTLISWIIYDIYVFIASDILKESQVWSFSSFKSTMKLGLGVVFDRVTGKIATVVFNIYASKLGTELYAIHGICYSLGVFTENITSAMHNYYIVELAKKKSSNKLNELHNMMKKYSIFMPLIAYTITFVLLIVTHGVVSLSSCFPYMLLYCSQCILIIPYESYRAYLTSEKAVRYLAFGGVCGICIRIPIVVISYYLGLGLVPFALASGIDFFIRGIYYRLSSLKWNRDLVV